MVKKERNPLITKANKASRIVRMWEELKAERESENDDKQELRIAFLHDMSLFMLDLVIGLYEVIRQDLPGVVDDFEKKGGRTNIVADVINNAERAKFLSCLIDSLGEVLPAIASPGEGISKEDRHKSLQFALMSIHAAGLVYVNNDGSDKDNKIRVAIETVKVMVGKVFTSIENSESVSKEKAESQIKDESDVVGFVKVGNVVTR